MSFFKKMTQEFQELKATLLKDDEPKDKKNDSQDQTRGVNQPGYVAYGEQPPYGQQPHGQQPSYGQQPPYGQQYGQPPPPSAGPPTSGSSPSLPPGWSSHWDQNSQRWYYVEQATGKTQWDPPASSPPPPPPPSGYEATRGDSSQYYNNYGHAMPPVPYQPGQPYSHDANARQYYSEHDQKEKKDGHGSMLAGAAGGLAVGAIGGALIGHAMGDDSDDERHAAAPPMAPPPAAAPPPMYAEPPPVPDETASGSSVSSSDQEDLEEAREELREAQEEYNEAYEDAYGSD